MNSKGSEWNIWDLHNHSNASDGKMTCEQLIDAAMAKGIKCLALTDHHTTSNIDEFHRLGGQKGLCTFSGIEFRTEYGARSVHMIGLFPREYNGLELNGDFLYVNILSPLGLSRELIIQKWKEENPQKTTETDEVAFHEGIFLVQVDFKNAANLIHKYGGLVTVHAGKKDNGIESEMHHEHKKETTIYDSLGPVKQELLQNGYVDFCEVGNEKDTKQAKFYWDNFKIPSIWASDAHELGDVGRNYCWVKAELSFEGLRHVRCENERISFYEPELLQRIKNQPSKFISSLHLNRTTDATMPELWFNNLTIDFNPGLVSIIGHKGSGKSALADIVSLCADTHNFEWSFLTSMKFRSTKPYNRAKQTCAQLIWADGSNSGWRTLDTNPETTSAERVRYIPQNYLENLCVTEDDLRFEQEIKSIIFQHIPVEERYGKATLDEMIDFLTSAEKNVEKEFEQEISKVNQQIINLEVQNSKEYLQMQEANLDVKNKEYQNLQKSKPKEVVKPQVSDPAVIAIKNEIETLRKNEDELRQRLNASKDELRRLSALLEEIKQLEISINALGTNVNKTKRDLESYCTQLDLSIDDIIKVSLNLGLIDDKRKSLDKAYEETYQRINNTEEGLVRKIEDIEKEIHHKEQQLSLPEKEYHTYLKALTDWQNECEKIVGNDQMDGTIVFFQTKIKYLKEQLPIDLETARSRRKDIVLNLINQKQAILDVYKRLYSPITSFIGDFQDKLAEYPIEFDASFINRNFEEHFFDIVSQACAGSFYGREAGHAMIKNIVDTSDLDKEGIVAFVESVVDYLLHDKREGQNNVDRQINSQLKNGHTIQEIYDYIFQLSYIEPSFNIKMGGKNLAILSPGERGALLLLFYLFLDKDDKPLILDQPEENLDNDSVYNYIVQFIREAKKKRQILMVTHNPNLAVVCDSDQIIYMNIDKQNQNEVSFESGAIESPPINNGIVKILEGTYPAFSNRSIKYNIFPRKKK